LQRHGQETFSLVEKTEVRQVQPHLWNLVWMGYFAEGALRKLRSKKLWFQTQVKASNRGEREEKPEVRQESQK
jgi:hypothetical protein